MEDSSVKQTSTSALKSALKVMNENLAYHIYAEMEHFIKKEYNNKAVIKEFKAFLNESTTEIETQINKLLTENNLLEKLEDLDALIRSSDPNTTKRCIFDDVDDAFKAVNLKNKRKCLEDLLELDSQYNEISENLKSECLELHSKLVKGITFSK